MKNKFDQLISNIFSSFLPKKESEIVAVEENVIPVQEFPLIEEIIKVDVSWDDISEGVAESADNSIISRSLRKHGYYGTVTQSLLVLEDGSTYIPENLTDHWTLFYSSPKCRPAYLTYNILSPE